jgi:hypothetical protein
MRGEALTERHHDIDGYRGGMRCRAGASPGGQRNSPSKGISVSADDLVCIGFVIFQSNTVIEKKFAAPFETACLVTSIK